MPSAAPAATNRPKLPATADAGVPSSAASMEGDTGSDGTREAPPAADAGPPSRPSPTGCVPQSQRGIQLCFDDPNHVTHFPAISADRKQVAVLQRVYDCCSDALTITGELRTPANDLVKRWLLFRLDDEGESSLSDSAQRQAQEAFNRALGEGSHHPMRVLLPLQEKAARYPLRLGSLVVQSRPDALLLRDGASSALVNWPRYKQPSHCCEDGTAKKGLCQARGELLGLWREANVVVLATGVLHERDGCEVSPSFDVHTLVSKE